MARQPPVVQLFFIVSDYKGNLNPAPGAPAQRGDARMSMGVQEGHLELGTLTVQAVPKARKPQTPTSTV